MQATTQQALERAILATAAYFDVLGLAVTPFELWRYLINPKRLGAEHLPPKAVTLAVAYELLGQPFLKERLETTLGFVHLKGRAALAAARIAATKQVAAKLKIARVIVRRLRWAPFLRAVFLSGSVAVGHPVKKSDLDLLIIAAEGRLWLCRTLVTLATFSMGVKRQGRRTRDRVCLNHYLTENHLAIPYPSLYNAFTYAHLLPLFEVSKLSELSKVSKLSLIDKFYEANAWLNNYILLPSRDPLFRWQLADRGLARAVRQTLERLLGGPFGQALERLFSALESRRIERDPRTHAPGGRVKVSRYALEFHPDSPEKKVINGYNTLTARLVARFQAEADSGLLK